MGCKSKQYDRKSKLILLFFTKKGIQKNLATYFKNFKFAKQKIKNDEENIYNSINMS